MHATARLCLISCGIASLLLLSAGEGSTAEPATTPAQRRQEVANIRQRIAHRGASGERPECTLSAIRHAITAGATAVEVDVRSTRDQQLVILHDATLDRTTDGHGPLANATLAEVKQLDAGRWFDPRYAGERVPTLAETLAACRGKIDVLLDLKEQGAEYDAAVAALVKKQGEPRRTIIGVRSVAQAKRFRELLPAARQIGLVSSPEEIEAFVAAGAETIRLWPRWLDDPEPLRRVRAAGAMLHLGVNSGTAAELLPLLVHRPESISSDYPDRLEKTLAELKADRR